MKRLLLDAIATEFSRGCIEKCKIFLLKSIKFKFVKSSKLEDFFKLDDEEEAEIPVIELFVLFNAEGLRKIDLSA